MSTLIKKPTQTQPGYVLILVVGLLSLVLILVTGLTRSVINENQFSVVSRDSERAFNIAEAGINYYTWFLNHSPGDFEDGQGVPGPYSHDFEDGDGNVIGHYVLEMEAPTEGSTIGTVYSTGYLHNSDAKPRRLVASIGIPSFAQWAFMTHEDVWFGDSETTDGKVHSNGGIRFDGTGNDVISSAKETYTCQPYHGCSGSGQTKDGVWGSGSPTSLWNFAVPAVDFDQISGDLNTLYQLGNEPEGLYFPTTGSSDYGYHLNFLSNGTATAADDTVQVYVVDKTWTDSGYTNEGNRTYRDRIRQEDYDDTYAMPANGVIFVDDNVWVSGQTSSRVTVAAATLGASSSDWKSIIIEDDLTYYAQDGTAVIGLVAQEDVRLAKNSPNSLDIHAVMLAQNGKVIYPYYAGDTHNNITTYGGIITKLVWTWSWVDGGGSVIAGYQTTAAQYDPYLIYQPPPYFPSTGEYQVLHWEELLSNE